MNEIAKTKKALRELGITPDMKGYHYIEKGVLFIHSDFESGKTPRSFMKLYNDVSDIFETKSSCVERCIRHAIEVAVINKTKLFDDLFGNIKNITASSFICIIAEHISQHKEF